jgi:hypothetical protein
LLDELFKIFERGGRRRDGQRQGGVRGFFSRMFGGGDDAGREDHSAPDRDLQDDDDDDHYARRSRRRDRDPFEFGDD